MPTIRIEAVSVATPEVRSLIDELDAELSLEYLPEQRHGLPIDALFEPPVVFFIARLDDVAMGCGGVALFNRFAEVKRMYVRPAARGRGLAQALLARIESTAAERGLAVLRLETGTSQADAIRLYERAGFRRCAAFGAYVALAPQALATSVFFEKRLG